MRKIVSMYFNSDELLTQQIIPKLIFSCVILTLVAWWTVDDRAREDNGLQLCCHGDCLC